MNKWKKHFLWPVNQEQATSVMGRSTGDGSEPTIFNQFCPEVSFDTFGIFASHMSRYSDEIDSDMAAQKLSREGAACSDWKWSWATVAPQHYSECPLYAPLSDPKAAGETRVDRILKWGKNNPIIAVLVVLGVIVAGAAGFGTNLKTLSDLLRGDQITVLAKKTSTDGVSYFGSTIAGAVTFKFETSDSQRKLQRITIDFPSDLSQHSVVVDPPFELDIGPELRRMNDVLQPQTYNRDLESPYNKWLAKGTIPVVLVVEYLTSSGDLRTSRIVYGIDFGYVLFSNPECSNCSHGNYELDATNFRFLRRLGSREEIQPLLDSSLENSHFQIEPGR